MVFKGWWSEFYAGWSSQLYPYLALFAALTEIYFSRRKLVIAGMFGMGAFVVGLFLHMLHWPGAALFIFSGITCVMLIPLWSAITTKKQKTLRIIISIWILIYGIGVLFKIFHWPAAGLFIISSIIYLPVLQIALGVSLWKSKLQQNDRNI